MEVFEQNKKIIFEQQSSYIRIADVMNFDGPLLTLFLNSVDDQLYLLDWFDVGDTYNRWLINRTTPIAIDKYISKKISTLDLFMQGEATCTSVDVDTEYRWTNPQVLIKSKIPSEDLPSKDAFFNKADCPDLPKLQEFLKSRMAKQRATA